MDTVLDRCAYPPRRETVHLLDLFQTRSPRVNGFLEAWECGMFTSFEAMLVALVIELAGAELAEKNRCCRTEGQFLLPSISEWLATHQK